MSQVGHRDAYESKGEQKEGLTPRCSELFQHLKAKSDRKMRRGEVVRSEKKKGKEME